MSIHVLEAATGGLLAQQVYARLREATLAIIIMSKDIESKDGQFFTKLNVVHEMGYLMRQLDAGRLAILHEEGVTLPTNVTHQVYVDFRVDQLALSYREIVAWLRSVSALANTASIRRCLESHMERLNAMVTDGQLQQKQGAEGKRRIMEDIRGLKPEEPPPRVGGGSP
jgi:hypothetical protein